MLKNRLAWRFLSGAQTGQGVGRETARRLGRVRHKFARAFATPPLSSVPDKTAMLLRLKAICRASCYCKFGVIQAFFFDKKASMGASNLWGNIVIYLRTSAHFNRLFETSSSPRATASKQTMQNIVMATHKESTLTHYSLLWHGIKVCGPLREPVSD